MELPSTPAEFLQVFAEYNRAMWPAVIALWLTTAVLLLRSVRSCHPAEQNGWINILLAVHWIWSGLVYHGLFFARINPAARLFAILFLMQGCFFLWFGFHKNRVHYRTALSDTWAVLGGFLVLYAMAYPAVALLGAPRYPSVPVFAVPCPTTILTSGLLLMSVPRPPIFLVVIPIVWSLIGTWAAFLFAISADWALAVAGFALLAASMAPKKVGIIGP